MIKIISTALIGIVAFVGGLFVQDTASTTYNAGGEESVQFGATSYPGALDSLTNPGATDSVAVVSHSSQHANANDAIEAIEAKVGTGASTAIANTVLAGNGTGSSGWTLFPTTTNSTATGLGTFGTLLSQGSTTVVGSLNITGNSTTTNATSTIGAFTNLATSTKYFGAGLSSCTGDADAVRWSGGFFSCGNIAVSASIPATYSTSTVTISYKIEYVNMTPGDNLLAWASCARTAENNALKLSVRPTSYAVAATTTLSDSSNDADSIFGMWQSTTTEVVMLETSSSGCDTGSGLQLMTLLINN
jgi:hypothetical protein